MYPCLGIPASRSSSDLTKARLLKLLLQYQSIQSIINTLPLSICSKSIKIIQDGRQFAYEPMPAIAAVLANDMVMT